MRLHHMCHPKPYIHPTIRQRGGAMTASDLVHLFSIIFTPKLSHALILGCHLAITHVGSILKSHNGVVQEEYQIKKEEQ